MKILVTGADGFLGKKLCTILNKNEIIGTSRKDANLLHLDVTDDKNVASIIEKIKPEIIVHAAALVNIEKCEIEKDLADSINVRGTENIARACKQHKIKLIYISSDYVFSGKDSLYSLDSKKDPMNYYGLTKSLGEEVIKSTLSGFAIVRPTILYGFNDSEDKNSFVLKAINKLKNNEQIMLDNKRTKYPLLIDDLARAIDKIISSDMNGVFHLSGLDAVTKYDWGIKVAEIFNLPEEKIIGQNMNEPYRPDNIKFNIQDNIIKVLNLEEGLKLIKIQMEKNGNNKKI